MTRRQLLVPLILIVVASLGSVLAAVLTNSSPTLGLDLQGGFSVVLQAREVDGQLPSEESVEKAKDIIRQRIDGLGVAFHSPIDRGRIVDIALDLSGRAHVEWLVPMPESLPLGEPAFDPQLAEHAVSSFAQAAAITLHVELIRGRNVHHIIEATFKGLARSLRDAVRIDQPGGVPSTKGVL